ncbi:TPA: host specificity protein J, partial [Escherichia coli]|nr:host specificity protein J [Escherichia coli]
GLPSGCSHWCRPRQRATVILPLSGF